MLRIIASDPEAHFLHPFKFSSRQQGLHNSLEYWCRKIGDNVGKKYSQLLGGKGNLNKSNIYDIDLSFPFELLKVWYGWFLEELSLIVRIHFEGQFHQKHWSQCSFLNCIVALMIGHVSSYISRATGVSLDFLVHHSFISTKQFWVVVDA